MRAKYSGLSLLNINKIFVAMELALTLEPLRLKKQIQNAISSSSLKQPLAP